MINNLTPIIIPIDKDKHVSICVLGIAKHIHEYYPMVSPSNKYIIFIKYTDGTYNIVTTVEHVFKGEKNEH